MTVLPYCDGDVFDLQGQRFTDSARDLADDDTSLKSSVHGPGRQPQLLQHRVDAGHRPGAGRGTTGTAAAAICGSSSPTRLSAARAAGVGVAYVAGAVQLFARRRPGAPAAVRRLGRPPAARSAPPTSARTPSAAAASCGGPAVDTGLSLPSGAETVVLPGRPQRRLDRRPAAGRSTSTGRRRTGTTPGEFAPARRELRDDVDARPARPAGWSSTTRSTSPSGRLELRTIVDPALGDVRIRLRLTDADGDSAVITPEGDGIVRALPVDRRVGKRWAQAVVADPAAAAGIDLDPGGAARRHRRQLGRPAVDPRRRRRPRHAGPGPRASGCRWSAWARSRSTRATARHVRGPGAVHDHRRVDPSRPAHGGRPRRGLAAVPRAGSGSTSLPARPRATIRYEYTGNNVDDYPRRGDGLLRRFAVRGAMTDKYDGRVTLLDDDPAPAAPGADAEAGQEGGTIRIRVALSAGHRLRLVASGVQAVRGSGTGRRLAVGDLPRRGSSAHYVESPTTRRGPLHRAGLYLFDRLRARRPHARRVTIPIRADALREGTERRDLPDPAEPGAGDPDDPGRRLTRHGVGAPERSRGRVRRHPSSRARMARSRPFPERRRSSPPTPPCSRASTGAARLPEVTGRPVGRARADYGACLSLPAVGTIACPPGPASAHRPAAASTSTPSVEDLDTAEQEVLALGADQGRPPAAAPRSR